MDATAESETASAFVHLCGSSLKQVGETDLEEQGSEDEEQPRSPKSANYICKLGSKSSVSLEPAILHLKRVRQEFFERFSSLLLYSFNVLYEGDSRLPYVFEANDIRQRCE